MVACHIFRFRKWSGFAFWNSGTRITNTRTHSIYSSQTGTFVKEWQFTTLATLLVDNGTIHTFSKELNEGYRTSNPSAPNVPFMEKPCVWFALTEYAKSLCGKVIFQEKMQVNGLHLYFTVTFFQNGFSHTILLI